MSPITNLKPAVFLKLNRSYRPGMSTESVYAMARRAWKINPMRHQTPRFAIPVYQNKILAVYRIRQWIPDPNQPGRWMFDGDPDIELEAQYVGTAAPRWGGGNPVHRV